MDQGALTLADPELLARFLLAGLHAVLLPLAHEDRPDREHALTSLSQLLRRLLAPQRTQEHHDAPGTCRPGERFRSELGPVRREAGQVADSVASSAITTSSGTDL